MRIGLRRDLDAPGHLRRRVVSLPLPLQRRLNRRELPIRMYWWRPPRFRNFGDELAVDVIERLWGLRCEHTPLASCEMVSVGSLMELTAETRRPGQEIDVWGSGFIKPASEDVEHDLEGLRIFALRGPATARRAGLKPAEVPMGDPGLLASRAYRPARARSHRIGLVYHYADEKVAALDTAREDPRFLLIDARQSPRKVVHDITSCELVLSSSLHGIIVAESFGVPAYWVKLSGRLAGGRYKFRDYFRGTGRNDVAQLDLAEFLADPGAEAAAIRDHVPVPDLAKRQDALIRAFPYNRVLDLT
ncbi:pyruvyl transferase [Nocardioides sp. J9]|uniref:polysaccharide pyruvyl transferase family protein n=1 Tax=unclassified Nocardioides TaxID=2615069 RepID=UPI00048D34B0|nr:MULTISPECIES: polysaccharide pyruvyl transferase family protein [unclassified Nocardioides]TWG90631.1 pyruvyl transferase [Nocardioides sp. J9]